MSVYYIEQKISPIRDKYSIYDSCNNPYAEVKGKCITTGFNRFFGRIISLGKNIYGEKLDGSELFTVKEKAGLFPKKNTVFINEEEVAQFKLKFAKLKPNFEIKTKEKNYNISSDILGIEFKIKCNGVCAAKISKARLKLTDRYTIDIYEDGKDELFLSAVIVIDSLIHS